MREKDPVSSYGKLALSQGLIGKQLSQGHGMKSKALGQKFNAAS
jgi:hypothetical protein